MGEFELIRRYFADLAPAPESVLLGIGDDGALLLPDPGQQLVVSVDTLVAGVHFPAAASADDIARRALAVNLSDLAAMGATPAWFTLALTLPADWTSDTRRDWVRDFSHGLGELASRFSVALVGGDTTAGPLSITLQVMGQVPAGLALRRDGAAIDDFVLVTGTLGDGAAALACLEGRTEVELDAIDKQYLHQRFYYPTPCLAEAALLRGLASAALDVSDGLVADLEHLCRASDVAACIDVESLPLSPVLYHWPIEQARQWALAGGDDYQLVFTLPPEHMAQAAMLQANGQLEATVIGRITAGAGVFCELDGAAYPLDQQGYRHFYE